MDRYGLKLNTTDEAEVEAEFYRRGGYIELGGKKYGNGALSHFKALISALCPWFAWHNYAEMLAEAWVNYDLIGVAGPASTSKTFSVAMFCYAEFYCRPKGTSIIMSSITLEGLRLRVWGAMCEILQKVKERRPYAPGYLVHSERRIYPQEPTEEELRDPRDAIMGIACKTGDTFVGITPYVGLKNDIIIGAFDEASLMPAGFWDSLSNLKKGGKIKTKFVGMGNPKDHYDALGKICEPLDGWESLPESLHSRTWKTRAGGVAVQLSGLDTPNGTDVNGKKCKGLNRFPYLITPEAIEADKKMYGEDSWQFQMMDLGVFPKASSSRRVITREICEKGNAFGEPLWDGVTPTNDYVGVDAAYSGVGGDRSPLIHIRTGKDINGVPIAAVVNGPILIPVKNGLKDEDGKLIPAEQQIATYVMDYCVSRSIPQGHFGYDSTGRGSLAHALALVWGPNTVPIEFGGLPPEGRRAMIHDEREERELYGKMVTALWMAVRNMIVQGQIRRLPMSVFEEGTLREFVITKSGKEDVEPKEETKKRLGRSPDLFDSLVAGVEVARRNGFVVGKAPTNKVADTVRWLKEKRTGWSKLRQSEVLVET